MHTDPQAAAGRRLCPNCLGETGAAHRHCPRCGQATRLHPPTLREFVHEFFAHYVALEGALWRSLQLLALTPGRLTRAYLRGERGRYVLPLRLYLTISIVFFFALRSGGEGPLTLGVRADLRDITVAQVVQFRAECAARAADRLCTPVARRLEAIASGRVPAAVNLDVSSSAYAPYVALGLVPVLAGLLALAYRRRRLPFGVHMVAALHLQGQWLLWTLAAFLLPQAAGLAAFALLLALGIGALRTVYGGRLAPALLRGSLVATLYLGAVLLVSLLAAAVAFLRIG